MGLLLRNLWSLFFFSKRCLYKWFIKKIPLQGEIPGGPPVWRPPSIKTQPLLVVLRGAPLTPMSAQDYWKGLILHMLNGTWTLHLYRAHVTHLSTRGLRYTHNSSSIRGFNIHIRATESQSLCMLFIFQINFLWCWDSSVCIHSVTH